jgi:hypothetical protein
MTQWPGLPDRQNHSFVVTGPGSRFSRMALSAMAIQARFEPSLLGHRMAAFGVQRTLASVGYNKGGSCP